MIRLTVEEMNHTQGTFTHRAALRDLRRTSTPDCGKCKVHGRGYAPLQSALSPKISR